jgi:Flp pilus assembly protein TadG
MDIRHTRRRLRQAGNNILESALVLVPTLAMIVGIVDVSFGVFARTTLQHAVREGTRYAVTYSLVSGMGHDASIKSVVQANAMGFLASDSAMQKVYVRYYDTATFTEQTGTGSNAPGNIVEVSVEGLTRNWIASSLLGNLSPMNFNIRSSDRMEGLPSGTSLPTR